MKIPISDFVRLTAVGVLGFIGFPAKVQKSIDRVGDVSLRADDLKRLLITSRGAPQRTSGRR
jgi:hypothetical protein